MCVCQSADAEVTLDRGASVRIVTADSDRDKTDGSVIWMDYSSLPHVLKRGSRIYIDDGLLALKVLEIGKTRICTRAVLNAQLNKHLLCIR